MPTYSCGEILRHLTSTLAIRGDTVYQSRREIKCFFGEKKKSMYTILVI